MSDEPSQGSDAADAMRTAAAATANSKDQPGPEIVDDGGPLIGIDAPVPKLPRGKGTFLSVRDLFRIGMLGVMLFAVLALRKPCSDGAATFMGGFEATPDGGAAAAAPAALPTPRPGTKYVRLRGDETEDELKKKLQAIRGPAWDAGAAASKDAATRPRSPSRQ